MIFNILKTCIYENKKLFFLIIISLFGSSLGAFLPGYFLSLLSQDFIGYTNIFLFSIAFQAISYTGDYLVRILFINRNAVEIFSKTFNSVLGQNYDFFLRNNSSQLSTSISQMTGFGGFLHAIFGIFALLIPSLFSIFLFSFISVHVSIMFFTWLIIMIIIFSVLQYKLFLCNEALAEKQQEFNINFNELTSNIISTLTCANLDREHKIKNNILNDIKNINWKIYNIQIILEIVFVISMISIFSIGCFIVNYLELEIVKKMLIINMSFEIFWRCCFVFFSISRLNEVYSKTNVALKHLIQPGRYKEVAEFKNLHFKDISIDIKNLSFKYNENAAVLNNINMKIKKNSKIAIVGPSGSGKSTLLSILLKLFLNFDGSVKINNIDLHDISKKDLLNNISFVSQNIQLFSRTIRQNISMGLEKDLSDSELDEICKQAQCYDFIQDLPEKYDTMLVERGANLSGGQKQRIAIARALAKNGSLVVFDEANSALDNETSKKFHHAMIKTFAAKTCIFISHKLKDLKEMDKIYLLQNGTVVESGTHDELMELKGKYYSLYNL